MSNTPPQSDPVSIDAIYARLNQRDIEQFYAGYQRWTLQQQIATLEAQLNTLRRQIDENTERMQEVHPSAIALATLARLQSNGVNDIDLLDRLLERGEMWLDRTMQQLDYCERLDGFISDDYTQWCKHALEGAYDWIDSIHYGSLSSSPPVAVTGDEQFIEATEELLLQKLSSDEEEDEAPMLETTLKRPALTIAQSEEPVSTAEDIPPEMEVVSVVAETAPISEAETLAGDDTAATDLPTELVDTHEHVETEFTQTPEEPGPGEVLSITSDEQHDVELPYSQEYVELEETVSAEHTLIAESEPTASLDYASSEESVTDEIEIQEHITTAPTEDTVAHGNTSDEPVHQEYVASGEYTTPEEPLVVESSSITESEQPPMQEFVEIPTATEEPSTASPESPVQNEEPVAPAASAFEVKEEVDTQPSVEEQWGWQPQSWEPKQPNFIVRLIKKILGI